MSADGSADGPSRRRERERLLGIDYGRKRIGLAAADPLWIAAHPIGAIDVEHEDAPAEIARICAERSIDRLVVGLPLHMSGAESTMSAEARAFGDALSTRVGIPVVYVDERLTSSAAEESLRGRSPQRRRKEKGRVDAVAAAQILKDYMEMHGGG